MEVNETEDKRIKRGESALRLICLIAMLYGIFFIFFLPSVRQNDLVNAETGVQVINVPRSFGEPVAVSASRASTVIESIVTIVFERGVVTVKLQSGVSYRIIYVDD